MSDTTRTEPVIRVRIAHSQTQKEGWKLAETTVEYTSGSDGEIDWEVIGQHMRRASSVGETEARARNSEAGA